MYYDPSEPRSSYKPQSLLTKRDSTGHVVRVDPKGDKGTEDDEAARNVRLQYIVAEVSAQHEVSLDHRELS